MYCDPDSFDTPYNHNIITLSPCDVVLGIVPPSTEFSVSAVGSELPPNHVCSNQSTCMAYYGAASPCCDTASLNKCLGCMCETPTRPAAVCVFCPANPCYDIPDTDGSAFDECPMRKCNRTSTPTPFTASAVAGEPDRLGTDILDPINRNLTVGVTYRFSAPSVFANWSIYVNSACDFVSFPLQFRLNVTSDADEVASPSSQSSPSSSSSSPLFTTGDEVLVNAATGNLVVTPSRPYTAIVLIYAIAGSEVVELARWEFTAFEPDVEEPSVARNGTAAHSECVTPSLISEHRIACRSCTCLFDFLRSESDGCLVSQLYF